MKSLFFSPINDNNVGFAAEKILRGLRKEGKVTEKEILFFKNNFKKVIIKMLVGIFKKTPLSIAF